MPGARRGGGDFRGYTADGACFEAAYIYFLPPDNPPGGFWY